MRTIITHWSVITGRDMKAGKVAPPSARLPVLAMPAADASAERPSVEPTAAELKPSLVCRRQRASAIVPGADAPYLQGADAPF